MLRVVFLSTEGGGSGTGEGFLAIAPEAQSRLDKKTYSFNRPRFAFQMSTLAILH